MMEDSITESTRLVQALQKVKETGKKSLIKSTDHHVLLESEGESSKSALVEEAADGEEEDEVSNNGKLESRTAQSDKTITLTSWKTQEFAYRKTSKIGYDNDDELPTLARGLFTCSESQGEHRIVVRGYDKFFNEGEMPWTRPDSIAAYSRPPYELSFKENGCIIFISALSRNQLIVTSKHSLGSLESRTITHAQKGEEWLGQHLKSVGKTKRELAQQLWDRNETAVAELCDDKFEEHVLAYPPERTGLHLHGLNANTAQFQTRSMKEVEQFARLWGFIPTRCLVMNSIEEVNNFTSSVAETGKWEGAAIEGFVVRTRMPSNQDEKVPDITNIVSPPYAAGQSWFYKVKFDEPYLMYRDWRELTRKMLSEKTTYDNAISSGHQAIEQPMPTQVKKKRAETQLYVEWCHERLYGSEDGKVKANPELFEGLHQNQGIIQLRDLFIEYMNTPAGQEKFRVLNGSSKSSNGGIASVVPFTKTLIVPIAVPGCGKTALAIALTFLFPGMGHTQSDDVQTKKTGPTFLKNITKELDEHDFVFADRNNHLHKHRDEIVKSVLEWEAAPMKSKTQKQSKKKKKQLSEPVEEVNNGSSSNRHVRLIALVWPLDHLPLNAVHHLCSDRIVERGDNHQSLRVELGKEHEQVLWQFLQTRQSFMGGEEAAEDIGDSAFHDTISLDLNWTFEKTVSEVAKQLAVILNKPIPSILQIQAAIEKARQYRVNVRKELKTVVGPSIRYYGLSLDLDLTNVVQSLVADDERGKKAFAQLVKTKRVIDRPHVTLVHHSELNRESDVATTRLEAQKRWDFYSTLHRESKSAIQFDMEIDCIAWDDRAMSLGISLVTTSAEDHSRFQSLQGTGWRPHITVGTFEEDIRPYEGKRVLCEADEGSKTVSSIRFKKPFQVQGRLRGLN